MPKTKRSPGCRGHHRKHHSRTQLDDGNWHVNARLERFVEPAVLLVLRDTSAYGYDLAVEVESIVGDRVDNGNLYRLLRGLEEDGLVESEWRNDLPGRSKRTYQLTEDGQAVLVAWAEAFNRVSSDIETFLQRHSTKPADAS